jgi:hypothetical protein
MLSRYGESRYLEQLGGALVHEDECGRLYQAPREDDTPLTMVRVTNSTPEHDGTRKVYWLRCHPELRPLLSSAGEPGGLQLGEPQEMTARNAVASSFGLRGEDYHPEVET